MRPKVRARAISRRKEIGIEIESQAALVTDQGMVEGDLDLGTEAVGIRPQLAERIAYARRGPA